MLATIDGFLTPKQSCELDVTSQFIGEEEGLFFRKVFCIEGGGTAPRMLEGGPVFLL